MLHRNHDLPRPKIPEQSLPKMKIINNNDKIYPGSDRFISLFKENPKLLGELLQKQISTDMEKLYQEKKTAGLSVTYRDKDYPDCLIREDADGKRSVIELDLTNGYKEVVIREIPPRHKAT